MNILLQCVFSISRTIENNSLDKCISRSYIQVQRLRLGITWIDISTQKQTPVTHRSYDIYRFNILDTITHSSKTIRNINYAIQQNNSKNIYSPIQQRLTK